MVFSRTDAGILFHGNIKKLKANLPFLPDAVTALNVDIGLDHVKELVGREIEIEPHPIEDFVSKLDKSSFVEANSSSIISFENEISENQIGLAANEILEQSLNYGTNYIDESSSEVDDEIIKYVLSKCEKYEDY